MTTFKTIKQRARITKWQGTERPELTMGYIVVERQFKVFKDGHMKLDATYPEKLLSVNNKPINCLWNMATLQEFFPGFSGYELEGEV